MRIGITTDLSQSFWSNGLNQNVKFLYDIFHRLGHNVFYITDNKPLTKLSFNHKYISLEKVAGDPSETFDVVICCGWEMSTECIKKIKSRKTNVKFFSLYLGNKIMFDMRDLIFNDRNGPFRFNSVEYGSLLSGIWLSPHHEFGAEYVKVAYGNDSVKVAPYVWDPFFVQERIATLKAAGKDPFFRPDRVSRVQVFESNTLINKNMMIPFCIAQRFDKDFPDVLGGVNIFCTSKLRHREYFKSWVSRFDIVKKKGFLYFNNRWCTLDAMAKWGGTIVSHQYDNDLNYAHFEALYMGIPLVHNSEALIDQAYYYPRFDVGMGSKQLYNAIQNHHSVEKDYMHYGREFVSKYSPYNPDILAQYAEMIK